MLLTMLIGNRAFQNQLYTDFPYIPRKYVRSVFGSNNGLYTPTHIKLAMALQSDPLSFKLKTIKTNVPIEKGKQAEIQDEDFEKERAEFLRRDTQVTQDVTDEFAQNQAPGDVGTSVMDSSALLEDGNCFECGCCFSLSPFVCFRTDRILCPSTNSSTAQHDSMSGRPSILHGMYGCLRFKSPRRAKFQDCLYRPIRVQTAISRI